MNLSDVPGIGPAKAEKLESVGVTTVKDLAEVDLRTLPDVAIGREVLKRAKQEARKICDKEGISYSKAAYGTGGGKSRATRPAKTATAKTPAAKPAAKPAPSPDTNGHQQKKGLFARLFGR